jgi:MFS family permease
VTSTKLRTAIAAVILLFSYNGLVIGAWAASIPSLQARFGLAAWQLSVLFVVMGLAAIASMQTCGRLADRYGARRISLTMIPVLCFGITVAATSTSLIALYVGAIALGIGNGGIDVAMNAIGVQVEKKRVKPIMSFFHGTWSIGNMVGALLLVLVAPAFAHRADPTVATVGILVAAVGVGAFIAGLRIVPETDPVVHIDEAGEKVPIPRAAYLLGLMAIAFGLGEGTANDWSGLHAATVAGVDTTTAALTVTFFAAFMVVIRLLGDFLVVRFGRRAVTMFGGACSAIGYLVVAIFTPLPVLLVGWSLVGLGVGMIAPQVYAVAGHTAGGRGLAVVVTFGYATFLISPAVIGFLVGQVGIQHTMFVPAVLLLGLLFVARVMPAKEQQPVDVS